MKKMLSIVFAIIVLFNSVSAFAQARGALTNTFASWYNVTTAQTTITLPFKSRDVLIVNGDTTDALCVSLKGETLGNACTDTVPVDSSINLAGGQEIYLTDFLTDTISLKALSSAASPVTVIVTY